MGNVDVSGLIKVCLLVLGVASMSGSFEEVQKWAILEFAKSLKTTNTPDFFGGSQSSSNRRVRSHSKHQATVSGLRDDREKN